MFLIWIFFVLHLIGAALWVGGLGFAWLALRPAMSVLEPAQRLALHQAVLKRFFLIVWHAIPTMFISGYFLVRESYGSMAESPPELHAMVGGGVLMTLIFLYVFFLPWKAARTAMAAGQTAEAAAAFASIRRMVGINLLLGLLTIAVAAWES